MSKLPSPHIVQVARYILGFSWIYQGFFPKLFSIAPIEARLTGAMGFSSETSILITRIAGVSEIVFGLLLIIFYTSLPLVIANIGVLIALLIYVAVLAPVYLVEAFNPVTTNLCMMGLSYVLLAHIRDRDKAR